jgi:hypothetical protein
MATQDSRNVELQELIDHAATLQFPAQGSAKTNRQYAWNCLRKYGLDPCKRLVNATVSCRGKPYAPTINDFGQLFRKAADLAVFIQADKKKKDKNHVTVIRA